MASIESVQRRLLDVERAAGLSQSRFELVKTAFETVRAVVTAHGERLAAIEASALRLTIVDTVADLPADASPRTWYRVATGTLAERAAIYVGNGDGRPLTKITPTAL